MPPSRTPILVLLAALAAGPGASMAQVQASASAAAPSGASAAAAISDAAPDHPARALLDRAVAALRTHPDDVLLLANQALEAVTRQPNADLEAQARILRCDHFNERDRDAAQRELEWMRPLVPRLRNPGLRAGMLGCEGEWHEQAGDSARALALYEQAVGVAETAHDDHRLADVLYLRGHLRGVVGEFPMGLVDLRRALTLYERLRLAPEARTTLNGVAGLYSRMGALVEARQYYDQAMAATPELPASRERLVLQHNLGRNLELSGQWDAAQRQYESTLAQARELHYPRGQAYALVGLASVRNAKGDGADAVRWLDEAQGLLDAVPDEPLRAQILLQRATALRALRRSAEGLPLLREAIDIFQRSDSRAEQARARDALARGLADAGEWRQAYDQQQQAHRLSQDLLRQQIDQRFATLKVQFDTDAKVQENRLLQRENEAIELALQQQRRAALLQSVAIGLASVLSVLLGVLAWRQRETSRRMRALAMTDELTGLPNRRQALQILQRSIDAGQDDGALLILDIDHFKRINDEYGHPVGDEMLRSLARAWRGMALPDLTLGRLGGEEFIAILARGDLAGAVALGEQLRLAVAQLDVTAWLGERPLTVSVGVAPLHKGDTLGKVLARADAALYRAKSAGRNRVEVA